MEAERRFHRVRDHTLFEFEGDIGEFLGISGREREVIQVAARSARIRFVLRRLVGRRGKRGRAALDVFLDLLELLLGLLFFGRGRTRINLDQDVARPDLRAAEEVAVLARIPPERRLGRILGEIFRPTDPVLVFLANVVE